MHKLNLVYFAWVKERLGKEQEVLEFPAELESVSDVIEFLRKQTPEYNDVFSDLTKLRFAVDQEFAPIDTAIGTAEELAIFPPVTGG